MALTTRTLRTFQRPSLAMSRKLPSNISSMVGIEEETLPQYRAKHSYPARIGETFVGKYEVVGKLNRTAG